LKGKGRPQAITEFSQKEELPENRKKSGEIAKKTPKSSHISIFSCEKW
jgi:hypothetical protein